MNYKYPQNIPTIMSFASLEGKFHCSLTPLALPGTKSLIYEAPTRQPLWTLHVNNRWYIGPELEHQKILHCIHACNSNRKLKKLSLAHVTMLILTEDVEIIIAGSELEKY